MATCDVWEGVLSCKSRVFLAVFLPFSSVAASIRLHNMHCLLCELAQDNQS